MRLVAVFCFIAAAPFIRGSSVLDERIVGGESTTIDQYPAIISLRFEDNEHGCAGTLVDNYTAVSCAHCFADPSELQFGVYGSSYLSKGGTTHEFAAIVQHPRYNSNNSWANDVAIIRLKTPVTLLEGASFAKLRSTPIKDNETCSVLGWGQDTRSPYSSDPLPDQLKRAEVYPRSEKFCKDIFGNQINPGNICAVPNKYQHQWNFTGDAFCDGDSGGPLHCQDGFTGIVSYGPAVCGMAVPDVYADVRFYTAWIEKTIEELSKIN